MVARSIFETVQSVTNEQECFSLLEIITKLSDDLGENRIIFSKSRNQKVCKVIECNRTLLLSFVSLFAWNLKNYFISILPENMKKQ